MLSIFKSNQPFVKILVLLVTILLCLPLFYSDTSIYVSPYFRFATFLEQLNAIKWFNFLIWIIVVFGEGLYLNYLANEFKLVNYNTHIPIFLFVLLNGFSPTGLEMNFTHFIHLFLLLTMHQLLLMYNERKVHFKVFNASLFIGMATLIYLPSVLLMGLIWFVIRYIKPIYWKEYIISILGFSVPFIYFAFYYFMKNELTVENIFYSSSISSVQLEEYLALPSTYWVYFIFIAVVGLFSIFYTLASMQQQVVKVRKFMTINLLLLFLLIIGQLIFESLSKNSISSYQLLIIPLTLLIATLFVELKRKKITAIIFYLLLVMIVINYVF